MQLVRLVVQPVKKPAMLYLSLVIGIADISVSYFAWVKAGHGSHAT